MADVGQDAWEASGEVYIGNLAGQVFKLSAF
jgi:hypothetical protein